MNELDKLRPEVRGALWHIRPGKRASFQLKSWETVHADMLRLAKENAEFREQLDYAGRLFDTAQSERERAEAELAALTVKIGEAKRVALGAYPAHGSGYVQIVMDPKKGDKVFRLVVEE